MTKTIAILLAFLVMGVADAMGPLSDAVKGNYQVSSTTATMLSFFVFIAFAVFSVPGGLLAARIGKKKLLLLGLGLNVLAMLVPTVVNPGFAVLLGCIFLLGIGTTFLQVAGNPIMRDVSSEGAYSRNLALAQGIKGLGSATSAKLVFAASSIGAVSSMGWRAPFPLFLLLMSVAFVLVALTKVSETQVDEPPGVGDSLALLKEPVFALAVLGIFLYVGAEASLGRFLKPTLANLGFSDADAASYGPTMFFLLLTAGRLLGGAILTVVSPVACFRGSALLGLVGAGLLMTGTKSLAVPAIVCAGLGFANIWPMLFSITVEHRPERANELSGLMCMAISGGAIVPLVMGRLDDQQWGPRAFLVPAVCFVYLLVISLKSARDPASQTS
ncbi:MAG: MFS transporter [Pirellulales bacterium]|nr:MFS transporter [Pirellulales bacterium]